MFSEARARGVRAEGAYPAEPCKRTQSPATETLLEANCALSSGGVLAMANSAVS